MREGDQKGKRKRERGKLEDALSENATDRRWGKKIMCLGKEGNDKGREKDK